MVCFSLLFLYPQLESSQIKSLINHITGRIKIGYVSAYFFDHIVGYILETMLKLHDSSKYEIFLYALNPPNGISFLFFAPFFLIVFSFSLRS